MEQLSLFSPIERLLISLKPTDYLINSIVAIGHKVYYKQERKHKWGKGHQFEKYNKPSYSEICRRCLERGYINDLNEFGK